MKTVLLILHSMLLLLVTAGSVYAATRITLHEEATVSGDIILLSDIASLAPVTEESKALGRLQITGSPLPGSEKKLQSRSIISSLRHIPEAANAQWNGAASITVTRKTVTLTEDRLFEIMAEYLAANRDKLPRGDIRFTSMRAPSAIHLPYGELSWRVTPSRPSLADSSSFSIFFKVDDKPVKNCTVRGRIEVIAPVAVSTGTIRRGTIISAEHFEMMRKNILSIDHPVLSTKQAVGMRAARTIGAGKAVEQDHLTAPPVVESGEMVKITAGKGNLRITTKGIARSSGLIGDTIRVKNLRSNKLIHARVDGPGMVSVEF